VTRQFFQGLAATEHGALAEHYAGLVDIVRERVQVGGSLLAPKYEWQMHEGPHAAAVSRDPWMSALLPHEVLPAGRAAAPPAASVPVRARAVVRLCLLPDRTPQEYLAELQKVVNDPAVTWRQLADPPAGAAAIPAPLDAALPRAVAVGLARVLDGS